MRSYMWTEPVQSGHGMRSYMWTEPVQFGHGMRSYMWTEPLQIRHSMRNCMWTEPVQIGHGMRSYMRTEPLQIRHSMRSYMWTKHMQIGHGMRSYMWTERVRIRHGMRSYMWTEPVQTGHGMHSYMWTEPMLPTITAVSVRGCAGASGSTRENGTLCTSRTMKPGPWATSGKGFPSFFPWVNKKRPILTKQGGLAIVLLLDARAILVHGDDYTSTYIRRVWCVLKYDATLCYLKSGILKRLVKAQIALQLCEDCAVHVMDHPKVNTH